MAKLDHYYEEFEEDNIEEVTSNDFLRKQIKKGKVLTCPIHSVEIVKKGE